MKYRNITYGDEAYMAPNSNLDVIWGKLEKGPFSNQKTVSITTNVITAAKASWGEVLSVKDKLEIEAIAEEIAVKANEAEGVKMSIEERLRKMVANAGLGKLAHKGFLRNGQRRKLRASQLMLAVEAGNTEK